MDDRGYIDKQSPSEQNAIPFCDWLFAASLGMAPRDDTASAYAVPLTEEEVRDAVNRHLQQCARCTILFQTCQAALREVQENRRTPPRRDLIQSTLLLLQESYS